MEADRVMVVHCWSKLQQLVNCNSPQTKNTLQPPTVLSQPAKRGFLQNATKQSKLDILPTSEDRVGLSVYGCFYIVC